MKKEVTTKDLRIFGIIWGVIFYFLAYKYRTLTTLLGSISLVFFVSAIIYPTIYLQIRFYQNWIKFGDAAGKINGTIITFILFYTIFVPTGFVLKLFKKDLLLKKLDPSSDSYFIDRNTQPADMRNQF